MNYIPVVGMLAGGARSKNNMVVFSFDPRGIYLGKSSSVSNRNTKFGFLNRH